MIEVTPIKPVVVVMFRKSVCVELKTFDADPLPNKHLNVVVRLFPVAANLPLKVTLNPVHVVVKLKAYLKIARIKYNNCLCFGTGTTQNNFLKK